MYYKILNKKRQLILPFLKNFKNDFYLAGGTGLAMQIGHRDSIDFDFFTPRDFDTKKLFSSLKEVFTGYKIVKIQEEKNTLTVLIDQEIKLSFFTYKYPLLKKTINEDNLHIASIEDIGCMKLSAITGRASNKDYVDINFILQTIGLKTLLKHAAKKFPDLDGNLILKSLVYFNDIEKERIIYKNHNQVSFKRIAEFLTKEVNSLF